MASPAESPNELEEQASSDESSEEHEHFTDVIASLDVVDLQELALAARRKGSLDAIETLSCSVRLPPRTGSFNIVYEIVFSDDVRWALRIPGEALAPADKRDMELDIVSQRFISSSTSIPIPKIHAWSIDSDNRISRPFLLMDFAPGMNLSKVWNDKNWMTPHRREYIFEQLARWMTELSAFEFDQIGRLDFDGDTGAPKIAPFPDASSLTSSLLPGSPPRKEVESVTEAGPFTTTHAYLAYILSRRRQESNDPMYAVFQLFLSALPDPTLDAPPFVLCPPDFEYQNVLVADDGTITALIDWDGVFVCPRQGGAAKYPTWITTDWDPTFHGWSEANSEEENAKFDSPAELESYREMYLAAMDRASGGKLTHITRNSHVFEALEIGISNDIAACGIQYHLSKYVFGGNGLGWEVEQGIKRGYWFNQSKDAIAVCREVAESDSSSEQNSAEDNASDGKDEDP